MGRDSDFGLPPSKRLKLSKPCPRDLLLEGFPTAAAIGAGSGAPMARDSPAHEVEMLGSRGQIRKVEFVRIITQALFSLGYQQAGVVLEQESGIVLQSPVVTEFRQNILAGQWDKSLAALYRIGPIDEETFKSTSFLILQQKFLEFLDFGETAAALKTLRTEISTLGINTQRVHQLASFIMCPSRDVLVEKADWRGAGEDSRIHLLEELQELLPPSIMVPEKRLEHLVEQALDLQRDGCVFHNSLDNALSLYTDHRCTRDQIPSKTIQVLEAHEDEVWFLQFSHDGHHLASTSKDCTAIIWEVVDDESVILKHTLTGHQKPVSFVSWSPDSTMLLTSGNEEVVKLWDICTGTCKHTYDKPSSCFTSCAWFPDGHHFVLGGRDKCIYMWDLEGREVQSWKAACMPGIHDLAVTVNGSHMVSTCAQKEIRIYNLEEKSEYVIKEAKPITSLSVSEDGKYLLVNLVNEEIHLWDIAAKLKSPLKYRGHRQRRYMIRSCFGGYDQAFVASGSEDSQIYIWNRRSGDLLEVLPGHSGTVNSVSWNPINPHMFASASDDHTIRIWGLNRMQQRSSRTAHLSFTAIDHLANEQPHDILENLRPIQPEMV
ncbi:unnamed protein product [Sphagnum jensenii]|uniref:CTLH domain-containing protein n=1 Tax=Sphagnum jensenii TaxID=128206 RepID=A0ABP0WXR6_9BRYO